MNTQHTDDPNSKISKDVLEVLDTCHYSPQGLQDRLSSKYSKGEINSALQAMKRAGMVVIIGLGIWSKSPVQLRIVELEAENAQLLNIIRNINLNVADWESSTCGQKEFQLDVIHRMTSLKIFTSDK